MDQPYMKNLLHQEIEMLKKITHPFLISISEILEDDENIYIATELMEGGELHDELMK